MNFVRVINEKEKYMKKIMLAFLMVFMFGVTFFAVGCCGDEGDPTNPNKNFQSMAVKEGTLDTAITLYSEPDFSDTVVIITYDDESTKEVSGDDASLSFSNIDTNSLGEKTLTITYIENSESHELEVTITVYQGEVVSILGYEAPQTMIDFNANKNTFKDTESAYYVGDANEFVLQPQVIALFETMKLDRL